MREESQLKYDAWLHWEITEKCNLLCMYCFQGGAASQLQKKKIDMRKIVSSFIKKFRISLFKRSPKTNIKQLLKILEETCKVFRISFTGGEPFLVPNFIEICEALSRKHYVAFNTNLTSSKIEEFCKRIDPSRVVHFHASAHLKELERLHLFDRFVSNFLLCKNKGFPIFAQEVGHPDFISEVEAYKRKFRERGIELLFGPFHGEYKGKLYPEAYSKQEIKAFGFNATPYNTIESFYQKNTICNAGYNVAVIFPNGDVFPCYKLKEKLGSIYQGVTFRKNLVRCPFDFCPCPFKEYDSNLFQKAMKEVEVEKK